MSDLTPMMKQYLEIKKKYPDAILFFRLGDFYEMFGEDAKIASKILQIALTARSAGENRKIKMPMCGVPYHAGNSYILKLINNGYKVAICEQVEDPKLAKGIVKREIIKIITPGTLIDESGLEKKSNNYLLSCVIDGGIAGISFVDVSTGEFLVQEVIFKNNFDTLIDEIERIYPKEILLPESYSEDKNLNKNLIARLKGGINNLFINFYSDYNFEMDVAYKKLTDHFNVMNLQAFEIEGKNALISASGAIFAYLYETQKTVLFHINKIKKFSSKEFLYIDAVGLKNLEILEPSVKGTNPGSLYDVLDFTQTAMGGRKLKKWLSMPLLDIQKIKKRQDIIQFFIDFQDIKENIKELLEGIADLERIAGKLGSSNVNARDLIALKRSLELIEKLQEVINKSDSKILKENFNLSNEELKKIHNLINNSIVDEPPITIKEGGIIKPEYDENLKKIKEISENGKKWIATLQERERERTKISSLKVGYTSVFGYYIEVSKANLKNVPSDYIRKQTLVNAERFITPELKEYESSILNAQEKIKNMEYEIFCKIRDEIVKNINAIQELAEKISDLDCLISLSIAATNNNYVKPEITDSFDIVIKDGRHPVVEKTLGYNEFIANDTQIDNSENMVLIITGPNMAGKSTYMRQVALIVIMAQIGSFVPASYAKIGMVDRIFTRVGASDFLARGLSTFMVEMVETANILNNATEKSLILLDEVGRGTSTFDGVSIAWAITEYIHNYVNAKTLFATHYFELTEISDYFPKVKNYNIQVKEVGDKIIFLRKIVPGSTDRSYGIHVAKLAGLPEMVIERAREILKNLEAANYTKDGKSKIAAGNNSSQQMDLFSLLNNEIIDEIDKIDIENITPLQAFNKLKELKEKLK
jgi:DNA mismatch repair protein MutS